MGRKVAAFTDSDLSSYRRKDGWFFKIEIFERYIEKKVKGMRRELSRIGLKIIRIFMVLKTSGF